MLNPAAQRSDYDLDESDYELAGRVLPEDVILTNGAGNYAT